MKALWTAEQKDLARYIKDSARNFAGLRFDPFSIIPTPAAFEAVAASQAEPTSWLLRQEMKDTLAAETAKLPGCSSPTTAEIGAYYFRVRNQLLLFGGVKGCRAWLNHFKAPSR